MTTPRVKGDKEFKPIGIIHQHKRDEFDAIPIESMMDFCAVAILRDFYIIQTWMDHFKSVGVPYVVTQIGRVTTLWKQRRV